MKRWLSGILAFALVLTSFPMELAKAADASSLSVLDTMDYAYTGAADIEVDEEDPTASDLNKAKFGSKKEGYSFAKGNAKLFASVTGSDYKGLEWCQDDNDAVFAEYEKDGVAVVEPVMAATSKNPWTKDTTPYFEVQFSTKEYCEMEFTAYVGASKKGPRDYQLSYAVGDSTEFTNLTDANAKISLADNKVMTKISGVLPEAANKQDLVKVRINVASMLIVDCTDDAPVYLYDNPTKGEVAVNHISISGKFNHSCVVKPGSKEEDKTVAEEITVKRAVIKKAKLKNKKVTIQVKKITGVAGYQYRVGSNKKVTKNKVTKTSKKNKITIKKWKKKKCFVKVRAYKLDSKGKKVYGKWSKVKKA